MWNAGSVIFVISLYGISYIIDKHVGVKERWLRTVRDEHAMSSHMMLNYTQHQTDLLV